MTAVWWVRRDLRMDDNPALQAACAHGTVIPLYIHAPEEEGAAAPGAASRWWLHHSLMALDQGLRALGARLIVRAGRTEDVLSSVLQETGAEAVYWNRQYAPSQLARDAAIKAAVRARGVRVCSFNGALLFEPWDILRQGKPYRVFTPFWTACQSKGIEQTTLAASTRLPSLPEAWQGLPITDLGLLPGIPWDAGFSGCWTPGEAGAWRQLERFLAHGLGHYKTARDRPGEEGTSRLSAHLHFGELSPRQIVRAVLQDLGGTPHADALHFFSELGWREFAHHLLYHFPYTVEQPLNPRWSAFPWPEVDERLWRAWSTGQTGIPLVDAGMRELWQTGWMHNRVRMNAASLLVKNMLIPWQRGEQWFRNTLVDADLANNVLGWQWTAGCGADAAPYFRIFNPVLQGERFDAQGAYVRRWVLELASVPNRWLHRPWAAPPEILSAAGVTLGTHYPQPIVDLGQSRAQALRVFTFLKIN